MGVYTCLGLSPRILLKVEGMTANVIRDTAFVSWEDPDAWMENMTGKRWEQVLQEEQRRVNRIVEQPAVSRRIGLFKALYASQANKGSTQLFECESEQKNVYIDWINFSFKIWKYGATGKERTARDIFCTKDSVYVTTDIGDGAEKFQLECWKFGMDRPIWKIPNVGPDIGISGNKIFYLGVKNKLIYNKVFSCNLETGNDKKLEYSEIFTDTNLALERQPEGRLLLIRDNSQDVMCFPIQRGEIVLKSVPRHKISKSCILPIGDYGVDFSWESKGLLVTKQHGKKILWHCSSRGSARKLLEIPAGNILMDPFATWKGSLPCHVRVSEPHKHTVMYTLNTKYELQQMTPVIPTGFKIKRFSTTSFDGTVVYGAIVYKASSEIRHCLVTGYGAYGIETNAGGIASRWFPLLENNWCIVITFIRGGGDHTEEWGKEGRRYGRIKSVEDFKSLIQQIQRANKITPEHTVIYGRSAGGLLMGITLAENPKGNLMRGVFTEVPYVDLLRTTTNPSLPLTELEYNEFGNPNERLEDFITNGLLSPADSASIVGAPNILVLARTAENDSQVFTYESLKWIRRLRSHDTVKSAPKLCIVERGQGHFTPPDETIQQWAIDCAILDAWVDQEIK